MNNYFELLAFIGFVFALLGIIAGFYLNIKLLSLRRYLYKNKYERYEELTSFDTRLGKFGPGGIDSLKDYRYIKSNLDDEDKEILKLKLSLKTSFKYTVRFFIMAFVSLISIFILNLFS